MASSTSNLFGFLDQRVSNADIQISRSSARATKLVNERWPGGLAQAVIDYNSRRSNMRQIMKAAGIQFRPLRRVMIAGGAVIRNNSECRTLAHAQNPHWASESSRRMTAKNPCLSAETRAKMSASKIRLYRNEPHRHPNRKQPMSPYERAFGKMLIDHGVPYRFNDPAQPYWIDFNLTTLGVGVEIHKARGDLTSERDQHVRAALGLRSILYISTTFFRPDRVELVRSVIEDLISETLPLDRLGTHTLLCIRPNGVTAISYRGIYLICPWESAKIIPIESLTP